MQDEKQDGKITEIKPAGQDIICNGCGKWASEYFYTDSGGSFCFDCLDEAVRQKETYPNLTVYHGYKIIYFKTDFEIRIDRRQEIKQNPPAI